MKQPRTLDEAHAAYPSLSIFLSVTGGSMVSLEIVTGDDVSQWEAPTEAEVWAMAFPDIVEPPVWPPSEQMQRELAAATPGDTGIPAPIGLFD